MADEPEVDAAIPSEDQGADSSAVNTFEGFSRWTLGAIGAGFPVLVLVIHAYILARGNMLVASEVLRLLDPIPYLATVLLMELRSGLLVLAVALYRILLIAYGTKRAVRGAFPPRGYFMIQAVLFLIGLLIGPSHYASWVILCVSAILVGASDVIGRVVPWKASHLPKLTVRRRLASIGLTELMVVGFAVGTLGYLALSTPYPSPEAIRLESESPPLPRSSVGPSPSSASRNQAIPSSSGRPSRPQPTSDAPSPASTYGWGYVLGTDDTSTTILYADGRLERIPNDQMKERAICPPSLLFPSGTIKDLYLIGSAHHPEPPAPPVCKQAGAPPHFSVLSWP